MKFKEWFKYRLHVNRFPMPTEILNSKYDYIINVSDEFIPQCYDSALKSGIKYFWFPMSECIGDMGISSLFGALQILFIAEHQNAKVLLHCHAGANRSPTVQEAYYFLRTKTHFEIKQFDEEIEERLQDFLDCKKQKNNRLLGNVSNGHLPAINIIESFLINCEKQFQKDDSMRGGSLDVCKHKSGF